MPPSLSRAQLDALGERLVRESPAREADLVSLAALRAEYLPPLLEVAAQLRERAGVQPSYRLKTNAAILDALRRAPAPLGAMEDIGGLRVVVSGSLDQQDRAVERIAALFRQPRIEDRRVRPSAGYRAVHLIAGHRGFPLEIQVLTRPQDHWAQMFARLADRLGPGIRYGAPPAHPEAAVGALAAHRVVEEMMRLSSLLAGAELIRDGVSRVEGVLPAGKLRVDQVQRLHQQLGQFKLRLAEYEASVASLIEEVAAGLAQVDG